MIEQKFIKQLLQNRWHVALLILALIFLAAALIKGGLFRPDNDFAITYQSAAALISGAHLYFQGGFYIYPPLYAFLLTPLTYFPLLTARWIWLLLNIPFLMLICLLTFSVLSYGFKIQCTRWQAIGACALTILLMNDQILRVFTWGQNDILILLGFVCALYCLCCKRRTLIAGFILGLIAMIKYETLFLLPLLVMRARWSTIIGLVLGLAVGACLPALLIGWRQNLEYLQIAYQQLFSLVAQTPAVGTLL